jgi:hypothetical protein
MPENFMREVLDRLDHLVEKTDTIAERAENAAINSAKARTGNKLLTAAVILLAITVVISGIAVLRANSAASNANDAAEQAKALASQQDVDREASRLASCQSRNSAQEAGRQALTLALTNFIESIAVELPDSIDVIERVRESTLAGQPTFEGIDTDCNGDGFYTIADYASITPEFPDDAVPVPDSAPTIGSSTTQPGG